MRKCILNVLPFAIDRSVDMKVDLDKLWANNELSLVTTKATEILSTLYFTKYEHSSEIEEQMEDWSLDDLATTYECVVEMYTYEYGDFEENEFAEPEFATLSHEFYNAANLSDARSYFIAPNSNKKFF